jgi:hypothetical protein
MHLHIVVIYSRQTGRQLTITVNKLEIKIVVKSCDRNENCEFLKLIGL